jgi:hypothetical protein
MAVTPRQIYTALINAGATTVQAIGIMANGLAESSLNPEEIGDNGTSFGLWQEHGTQYAGLVTGNPTADMNAQVKVLALNKGFAAASGATAGAAAGNFSANYERCTTCQPGQASYNARVANAAVVAGWVTSGSWPASAPGSATGAGAGSGSSSASGGNDCAFGPTLPLVGTVCLVQRQTVRRLAGGLLMASGGGTAVVGVILLAAFAFRASGAQRTATQIGATLTPAGRAARPPAAARAAGSTGSAGAGQAEIRRGNQTARKAAGSPAQGKRAAAGQAPRKPPPPPKPRPPRAEHHEARTAGERRAASGAEPLRALPPPG